MAGMSRGRADPMSDCSCRSHGTFLTSKGLAEAAQRKLELRGFDSMELESYVDKVGSVSASDGDGDVFVWDDRLIEDQYRRFLNGS